MKRLPPLRRKQIILSWITELSREWTCKYGSWTKDRMFREMETILRTRRHKAAKQAIH